MRRGLWFVAGAGAGMYAAARARRAAEALTADGLRDRWGALRLGARMVRDEVATGSAEAESQLRRRYGLVPHGRPELRSGVVSTGSTTEESRPTTRERGPTSTHDDSTEGRP